MTPLSFADARSTVLAHVAGAVDTRRERVALHNADGRVLAVDVRADRDMPPLARSMRDGYAVRAADTPGALRVIGETRAGQAPEHCVQAGEAVAIMTGAAMPMGADAVVMVEHVRVDATHVHIDKAISAGTNWNPAGADARAKEVLLEAGTRIGPRQIALLASVGAVEVDVYAQPRVAILSTGDEIVDINQTPAPHQVRNSNAHALAAQVRRAGGVPEILPTAPDELARTKALLEIGLRADLLLISGGVSAGKYDVVETALAELDAEFFFDRVLIQPGQPLVFGRAQGTPFFGLPGNPASTYVCFEVFARAALERLSGLAAPALPITEAVLTQPFRHRGELTRFLPALLAPNGRELTPLPWSGSGDLAAQARANALLIAEPDRTSYAAGATIGVLLV